MLLFSEPALQVFNSLGLMHILASIDWVHGKTDPNVLLKSSQNKTSHRGKGNSCQVSRKGIGGLWVGLWGYLVDTPPVAAYFIHTNQRTTIKQQIWSGWPVKMVVGSFALGTGVFWAWREVLSRYHLFLVNDLSSEMQNYLPERFQGMVECNLLMLLQLLNSKVIIMIQILLYRDCQKTPSF